MTTNHPTAAKLLQGQNNFTQLFFDLFHSQYSLHELYNNWRKKTPSESNSSIVEKFDNAVGYPRLGSRQMLNAFDKLWNSSSHYTAWRKTLGEIDVAHFLEKFDLVFEHRSKTTSK